MTARIALANLPFPASPEDAVRRVLAAIGEARRARVELIAFPECYVPGYRAPGKPVPPADPAFLDRAHAAVAEAAGAAGLTVVLGTERIVDGALRATALVAGPDGAVLGWQDKVQLDPSEDALFAPGTERHVFRSGPFTFGVVVCHEGWRYPETVRWAARRGAWLVLHPHFSVAEAGDHRPTTFADPAGTFHEGAMRCRAAENGCWFASVNTASEGAPTTSAVIRPDGAVLAWQPHGEAGLLVADVDPALASGLLPSRLRTFER